MAAGNSRLQEQPQVARFYWTSFEQMGKIAGVVISLLTLCGILFAAGSKLQHFIDDLANLHKQVDEHEERLQQNEANAIPIGDKLYMAILYYYQQALRLKPNLAGQLIVICKADRAGYLAASEVIASSPELSDLAQRLTARIRRWRFPEHVTGLESGSFRKVYFLSPQGF